MMNGKSINTTHIIIPRRTPVPIYDLTGIQNSVHNSLSTIHVERSSENKFPHSKTTKNSFWDFELIPFGMSSVPLIVAKGFRG